MTDVVPEYWESTPPAPARPVRPIGILLFLPALLGQFVLPGRLGPRLARSSIFAALLVHGLALLLGTGCVALGLLSDEPGFALRAFDGLTRSEQLRLPAVVAVERLQTTVSDVGPWPLLLSVGGGHVGCWLLAWGILPLVAGRGKRRRSYGRALKLVLWSSVAFVPVAIGLTALLVLVEHFSTDSYDRDGLLVAGLLAWGAYWLHLLVWLSARVPQLEQQDVERRLARCGGCGYQLTGLPTADGHCPECGLEVTASLPETRQLPAWATARGVGRRLAAFFGTSWRILRQPHFFRTLAVYDGQTHAIRFAVRACWLVTLWVLLVDAVPLASSIDIEDEDHWVTVVTVLSMLTLLALLIAIIVGGAANLMASRLGWRDPRPTTVVTGYAAALFLPFGLLLPLSFVAIGALHELTPWGSWVDHLPTRRMLLAEGTMLVVVFTPPALALVFGLRRYFQGLHDVRFAVA